MKYFKHKTSIIDKGCKIGKGSKIWLLSQLVTELYFEIDVIFKIDSRTVDQDIQIFSQNVNIYRTKHPR